VSLPVDLLGVRGLAHNNDLHIEVQRDARKWVIAIEHDLVIRDLDDPSWLGVAVAAFEHQRNSEVNGLGQLGTRYAEAFLAIDVAVALARWDNDAEAISWPAAIQRTLQPGTMLCAPCR
jgi:hypothetical protein